MSPTKKKSTRIPNPYARRIPLPCRVNAEEMQIVLGKALKWEAGNVSELVRKAVLSYTPKDGK